ncbi:GumC family protein [Thermodesulfobacteriota bacterium]
MEKHNTPEVIHLSDYWYVIRKRRYLLLLFLFMTVLITMALSFGMKPIFEASTKIIIERESTASPVTGKTMEYIDGRSQALNFNTHFKLIKSKAVIQSLIDDINNLKNDREQEIKELPTNVIKVALLKIKNTADKINNNVRLLMNIEQEEITEQKLLDLRIKAIQNQIDISDVRDTRLLIITVHDEDPEAAAFLANLLAKKYIEFDLASRLDSANQNLEWLNQEVYALKKRLEDDERAFYDYKQKNKVFSLEGKQEVIALKITEMNNEYLATKSRRQELDAKLNEIERLYSGSNDISYVRSVLNNKTIDDIYANLTDLELERNRLAKVFKSKHPKMQQNTGDLLKVNAKLKAELSEEIENLQVQRNMLLDREKSMEQMIDEFEDDALDTSGKELKYTILQRSMETSQSLYDSLIAKIKESGIASTGSSSNIRIVEHASAPVNPVKPNKRKNLLLSIIIGLFGGVSLVFILEYLDQTVRTEDDVKKYMNLSVLSVIPETRKADRGDYY